MNMCINTISNLFKLPLMKDPVVCKLWFFTQVAEYKGTHYTMLLFIV